MHRSAYVLMMLVLAACSDKAPKERDAGTGTAGTDAFGNATAGTTAGDAAAGTSAGAGAGGASGTSSMPMPMNNPDVENILGSACFKSSVQSDLLPANILFVVDRSGSMLCNPPPTTESAACEKSPSRVNADEKSKWEITSGALSEALKALPETATVGISYFSNDDSCGVTSTPNVPLALNSLGQQNTVTASLMQVTPAGGTPIVGATILAYKHMHEAALAGRIFGNEYVVLITDGQQSEQCNNPGVCDDAASCTDYLVQEQVPKAAGAGAGIRTFVIGVPGSEPSREILSQLAQAGGTAANGCDVKKGDCHFDMTKVDDLAKSLAEALTTIAGKAVACELPVPQPSSGSIDLTAVNVVYTPSSGAANAKVLPQDTNKPCDEGANGWQYTADNTKIRLCGAICDTVRADAGARVDVALGCPVVLE